MSARVCVFSVDECIHKQRIIWISEIFQHVYAGVISPLTSRECKCVSLQYKWVTRMMIGRIEWRNNYLKLGT